MNHFLFSEASLYYSIVIYIISALLGYFIVKRKLIIMAWVLLIITTVLIDRYYWDASPIFRMLTIITSVFICMKIITATENYKSNRANLTLLQWFIFVFTWAGMRPTIFETMGDKPLEKAKTMIYFGFIRIIIGGFLIFLAHKIFLQLNSSVSILIVSVFLLVGFSLIIHFGILAMSAGIWRLSGVKTYYLFNSPLKSNSLGEFWSKRWNIAFSEMTSISVYRPLKKILGTKSAFLIAFLFSGLLHEMAISLPVHKGFGLPLLYFVIQGTVMMLEEFLVKKNITFFKKGFVANLWVYFWVIIPTPILFHYYFVKEIVWPLAGLCYP